MTNLNNGNGSLDCINCQYNKNSRSAFPCPSCTMNLGVVFNHFDPAINRDLANVYQGCPILMGTGVLADTVITTYDGTGSDYRLIPPNEAPGNRFMPAPVTFPAELNKYELMLRMKTNQLLWYKEYSYNGYNWNRVAQYMILDHTLFGISHTNV